MILACSDGMFGHPKHLHVPPVQFCMKELGMCDDSASCGTVSCQDSDTSPADFSAGTMVENRITSARISAS
jgi:hypothetical protein